MTSAVRSMRSPPGVAREALSRRPARLRLVEAQQRSAAAVAEQDDLLEAALLEVSHAGGDIEEQALVHHVDVVVEVTAVMAEDGVAARRQPGDDVVARELAARVHEVDGGLRIVVGGR